MERVLIRSEEGHRRAGPPAGAAAGGAAGPRAHPGRRRARPGQDDGDQDPGRSIGGEFKRIQFTPDLVPADLVGTRIYNQKTGEFNTSLGPVFTNLLLADEINRAPAKVQSALLEVMQERQVTIGRETYQCRTRSWSWPRRTRSRPKAPTRCPKPRSTASCSRCWSATPPTTRSSSSSSA